VEQGKTVPPPAGVDVRRADRPLGRSLEDISHLFLTQKGDEAPAQGRVAGRQSRPLGPTPAETGAVVLRPSFPDGNERLGDLLREFAGVIEEGLQGIDARVPCDPYGEIDMLALDRANQLVIVDFDIFANDQLVLRGIGHFDWVVRNLPIVRRMYQGRAINFSTEPRLLLLAPDFPPLALSAARQVPRPRLGLVRYRFVETSGGPGVFFERVEAERE